VVAVSRIFVSHSTRPMTLSTLPTPLSETSSPFRCAKPRHREDASIHDTPKVLFEGIHCSGGG